MAFVEKKVVKYVTSKIEQKSCPLNTFGRAEFAQQMVSQLLFFSTKSQVIVTITFLKRITEPNNLQM
jgi:hypothetical protein